MQGELGTAQDCLAEALSLARALRSRRDIALTLGGIAEIRFASGRVDDAIEAAQEALASLGPVRDRSAWVQHVAGAVASYLLVRGDVAAAWPIAAERLVAARMMGLRHEVVANLERLGLVAASLGELAVAGRILGHGEAYRSQRRLVRSFASKAVRDRLVALLAERLPHAELERLMAEGAALSDDEVRRGIVEHHVPGLSEGPSRSGGSGAKSAVPKPSVKPACTGRQQVARFPVRPSAAPRPRQAHDRPQFLRPGTLAARVRSACRKAASAASGAPSRSKASPRMRCSSARHHASPVRCAAGQRILDGGAGLPAPRPTPGSPPRARRGRRRDAVRAPISRSASAAGRSRRSPASGSPRATSSSPSKHSAWCARCRARAPPRGGAACAEKRSASRSPASSVTGQAALPSASQSDRALSPSDRAS
jgi:hypothetical protein